VTITLRIVERLRSPAKALGIHKTTLWRKMKQLGIALPDRQ
jgi:transcriptional regulator of acetoin/glycerol metabolism